jgi:hypothetical protein
MLRFADLSDPQDQTWLKWAQAVASSMLDNNPDLASLHIARWLPKGATFMGA